MNVSEKQYKYLLYCKAHGQEPKMSKFTSLFLQDYAEIKENESNSVKIEPTTDQSIDNTNESCDETLKDNIDASINELSDNMSKSCAIEDVESKKDDIEDKTADEKTNNDNSIIEKSSLNEEKECLLCLCDIDTTQPYVSICDDCKRKDNKPAQAICIDCFSIWLQREANIGEELIKCPLCKQYLLDFSLDEGQTWLPIEMPEPKDTNEV